MFSFVVSCLQQEDFSWVPRGRALRIPDTSDAEQQETENRLVDRLG